MKYRSLIFTKTSIAVITLCLLAPLILFLFRTQQQTGDSLNYLYNVKTCQDIIHPHHMFYIPALRIFWISVSGIFKSLDILLAAQIFNIIITLIGVIIFFFVSRHLFTSCSAAFVAALCFLISRGIWELTTIATIYSSTCTSLILLMALLLIPERWKRLHLVWIALALCLAILMHQINVLFCAPLVLFFLVRFGKRGIGPLTFVLSLAGIMVLTIYCICFYWETNSISAKKFIEFCFFYSYLH